MTQLQVDDALREPDQSPFDVARIFELERLCIPLHDGTAGWSSASILRCFDELRRDAALAVAGQEGAFLGFDSLVIQLPCHTVHSMTLRARVTCVQSHRHVLHLEAVDAASGARAAEDYPRDQRASSTRSGPSDRG